MDELNLNLEMNKQMKDNMESSSLNATQTDDLLLAYVMESLDPSEVKAVETHLASHPEDAAKVSRLRSLLAPLSTDRDSFDPPVGLAAAAIARTAEYLVVNGLFQPELEPAIENTDVLKRPAPARPTIRLFSDPIFPGLGLGVRIFDGMVAAGIAVLALGICLVGINKMRQEQQILACSNNLREIHAALSGYGELHNGRFPEVGSPQVPNAGSFALELKRNGLLSIARTENPKSTFCPVVPAEYVQDDSTNDSNGIPVSYSYSLGYQLPNGGVTGLRVDDKEVSEMAPIAADLPVLGFAHNGRGQNVLSVGGNVRFCKSTAVGINGDDIYQNQSGFVRAGLNAADTSLGAPQDCP